MAGRFTPRFLITFPKRLLVGRPLRSERLGETLLPKRLALAVFCSDPLSSVAYATEEILLVLGLAGAALLGLAWWVAGAVVLLLVVVVASYRQTCHAYPDGGGAYAVSRANLGRDAALVAASALLVDYVLTVAVSVVAGVANVVSAFPRLAPHAVAVSVALVALLAVMNLRGVKESGRIFAVPTYGFVASVLLLLAVGAVRALTGHPVVAESASYHLVATTNAAGAATLLLALRAFASGCTALTGVEAVSNGVPNFRPPRSKNAADTLAIMGVLAVLMFGGITALALTAHVHVAEDPARLVGLPAGAEPKTVIAQLADATFGHSIGFFAVQAFTAAILVLAANTAFNGFPILASILGEDGYLPRQLSRRGDRLMFVLVTKFAHGAWIVVVAMPVLFIAMKAVARHYRRIAIELTPGPAGVTLPSRVHAVVLVSRLHTPTLRALAFARASRPDTLTALTVRTNPAETERLTRDWSDRDIPVPLTVLESPYRDITGPVLSYVARVRRESPRDLVVVFIPEYVVRRWWEHLLHNQSALRLKTRLLFQRGVMVTSVPWQLGKESEPVTVDA